MAVIPRSLFGRFGGGSSVIGVKTSLIGYDVTVLADDNDTTKRSFNSEWLNMCKLKSIGFAQTQWTTFSLVGIDFIFVSGIQYFQKVNRFGWEQVTPTYVATGLTAIPIWEERTYSLANKIFDDDKLVPYSNSNSTGSSSGGRSFHVGPSQSPANSLGFRPFDGDANAVQIYNQNVSVYYRSSDPIPPDPPTPALPTLPTYKPTSVFVIYSNTMGVVS